MTPSTTPSDAHGPVRRLRSRAAAVTGLLALLGLLFVSVGAPQALATPDRSVVAEDAAAKQGRERQVVLAIRAEGGDLSATAAGILSNPELYPSNFQVIAGSEDGVGRVVDAEITVSVVQADGAYFFVLRRIEPATRRVLHTHSEVRQTFRDALRAMSPVHEHFPGLRQPDSGTQARPGWWEDNYLTRTSILGRGQATADQLVSATADATRVARRDVEERVLGVAQILVRRYFDDNGRGIAIAGLTSPAGEVVYDVRRRENYESRAGHVAFVEVEAAVDRNMRTIIATCRALAGDRGAQMSEDELRRLLGIFLAANGGTSDGDSGRPTGPEFTAVTVRSVEDGADGMKVYGVTSTGQTDTLAVAFARYRVGFETLTPEQKARWTDIRRRDGFDDALRAFMTTNIESRQPRDNGVTLNMQLTVNISRWRNWVGE